MNLQIKENIKYNYHQIVLLQCDCDNQFKKVWNNRTGLKALNHELIHRN